MRLRRGAHTAWLVRAAALAIDAVPIVLAWAAWEAVALGSSGVDCVVARTGGLVCSATSSRTADVLFPVVLVLSLAYLVWNFGVRQGARGSSVGKSAMGFMVVSERTWQPVGFARSTIRALAHLLDAVPCFTGFLLPLVDARRQTLADKVMSTVCVPRTAGAGEPGRPPVP